GVALDADDLAGLVEVVPLEVDRPVALLGAAADVAVGDHPVVVPAAAAVGRAQQGLLGPELGDLGVEVHRRVAAAGGGSLVDSDRHGSYALHPGDSRVRSSRAWD